MKNSTSDLEISEIYRMALKDLGYDNVQIIFSDPKNSPQLLDEEGEPKSGTAFVDGKGVRTIIINAEDPKNSTRSGLIGTLTEEGSHIIGKIEGRQIATGTDEKGLESTGRATNEYFQDKYKGDDVAISIQSDGKDYSNVDFGENVGDATYSIGISASGSIAKVLSIGGSGAIGIVLDDKNNMKGFITVGGSIGVGIGVDYGFGYVGSYNPLNETVDDFGGYGDSFSANVSTPVFSGSLEVGLDGTLSLGGNKGKGNFNQKKGWSTGITYNGGYTFLIPLTFVENSIKKLENGDKKLESMKEAIWKLKGK